MSRGLRRNTLGALAALASLAGLLAAGPTWADEDGDGRRAARVPPLPLYTQECGSCHVAYPARLLPATSWQYLLQHLPHHFGSDASLGPAQRASLEAWLSAQAGTARGSPSAEHRITTTRWFVHKHDEVPAATWRRTAIGSPANCAACHSGAEQGDFNEHRIRIPR